MNVTEIRVADCVPFENYPFKIQDNSDMEMLIDSIKESGVLIPIVVRPKCKEYRLFYRFSSTALAMLLIVLIFNGLLAQLFSFLVDLSAQLPGIYLCHLCNPLLLELFLVGTGLDMGAVNENRARVDHSVIQRFVEDVLEDFSSQFVRKTLAESIAHRRKVRDLIQQSIPQKPAVG